MSEVDVSGVQNEKNFSESLNNKHYSELGENAAKFIKQLYPSIQDKTTIYAKKVGGKGLKPDVIVSVLDDETNVSIKKGNGNSVHQEKTSLFLMFCKDNLNMSDTIRNSFLAYLYGDGTLDGKGLVEDRLDGKDLKEEYKEDINNIQAFLLANSRALIERFLVYGRRGKELNFRADYLYHGFIYDGVWCPLDETVDFLVEKAKTESFANSPAIGPLTLQTWNRNLSGKADFEDRRHSIQIKWGGKIREYINKINEIYLEKIKKNPSLAIPRIFGDNSHGFKNAKEIVEGLNGCRVKNLRGSLLGLVNNLFVGTALTDVIICKLIQNGKPDIQITIGNQTKNVSVFIGSGNSVHQEDFSDFVDFCRNELNITSAEEEALRFIYYGDGTLYGTGKVSDRLKDARTIKQLYPEKVSIAQFFFDQHRRELAKRFLVTGKYPDMPKADCVFHGDVQKGISMSYDAVLDYIENFSGTRRGLLSIGPLSFQMWNRNLSGDRETEYKRESLQIKWPSMPERIEEAYSMFKVKEERSKIKGINAEYELVSMMNRNRSKNSPLWTVLRRMLDLPEEDVYAIRVSHQIHSDFLGQTIYPKSDIYLCKADISEDLLEEIGYALDEDVAKEYEIDIKPIKGSGISCKIPTSKKFTYAKISANNFAKIFGDNIIGAGASIFVRGEDIALNPKVLEGWNVTESQFIRFVNSVPRIPNCNSLLDLNEKDWSSIKKHSNIVIEFLIRNNKEIQDMIFLGKGLFDDPYYAPFIFSKGEMKLNTMPPNFAITTGSGRHKGNYTIIVKPIATSSKVISMYPDIEDPYASMVAEKKRNDGNNRE